MYKGRIVPLAVGEEDQSYRFGITSQTPQSLVQKMDSEYRDEGKTTQFFLISGSGFRSLMMRYDPPKQVIYDDIEIAREGDSETLSQVSKVLSEVGSNDVFNYLVDQWAFFL